MGRKVQTQLKKSLVLEGVPSKKQLEFFKAKNKYIAYGGARGGGKSWALRRKLILLAFRYEGIKLLIIRKSIQDLRENHIIPLKQELDRIADYNSDERAFYFPNGSRLKLGYCDAEADVLQYQGQEYDVIALDEGTQFTEYQFTCLRACLRGGKPNYPKRLYITCNPGGVGHAWVKRLFIDRNFKSTENPKDYYFIQALVTDNDYIMKNQPEYIEVLKSIPDEALRRAWLLGEWETFNGQFFPEFDKDVHVIEPFDIPSYWNRYYVNDYGLDALAGIWIAISPNNKAYVYREVFKGKDAGENEFNNGIVPSEASKLIKTLEKAEKNRFIRLAPPDLWSRQSSGGKSPIEMFSENGIYFSKAPNERVQGWLALKEWLKVYTDKDGKNTNLKIFKNCTNLIRCIPLLQYSSTVSNDVSKTPHDITHLPDALRYFASSRPFAIQNNDNSLPNYPFPEMMKRKSNNPYSQLLGGNINHNYIFGGY